MDGDGHIVMFGTIVLGTAAAAFVACRAGSSHRAAILQIEKELLSGSCMVADYELLAQASSWFPAADGFIKILGAATLRLSNRVDL